MGALTGGCLPLPPSRQNTLHQTQIQGDGSLSRPPSADQPPGLLAQRGPTSSADPASLSRQVWLCAPGWKRGSRETPPLKTQRQLGQPHPEKGQEPHPGWPPGEGSWTRAPSSSSGLIPGQGSWQRVCSWAVLNHPAQHQTWPQAKY